MKLPDITVIQHRIHIEITDAISVLVPRDPIEVVVNSAQDLPGSWRRISRIKEEMLGRRPAFSSCDGATLKLERMRSHRRENHEGLVVLRQQGGLARAGRHEGSQGKP